MFLLVSKYQGLFAIVMNFAMQFAIFVVLCLKPVMSFIVLNIVTFKRHELLLPNYFELFFESLNIFRLISV